MYQLKGVCSLWVFYDSLLLYHFLCHIFVWSSQEKRSVPNFEITLARVCVLAHMCSRSVAQRKCRESELVFVPIFEEMHYTQRVTVG
jgi:hypothetical protein